MKPIITTLLLICTVFYSSFACSCVKEKLNLKKNSYHYIFSGKVVNIEPITVWSDTTNAAKYFSQKISKEKYQQFLKKSYTYTEYEYTFEVQSMYKGKHKKKKQIKIRTGTGGGDCGYTFKKDNIYLVFANKSYQHPRRWFFKKFKSIRTNICTHTQILNPKSKLVWRLENL